MLSPSSSYFFLNWIAVFKVDSLTLITSMDKSQEEKTKQNKQTKETQKKNTHLLS